MSLYVANILCEITLSSTVRQRFFYSKRSTERDSNLFDLFKGNISREENCEESAVLI